MSPPQRAGYAAVFLLFLLSGATSLIYEVLWLRQLILIFGSTQFATSTILSTFMGGLALGAFVAGRWMTGRRVRPLQVYGWLEIGIGLYALLVPFLLGALTPLYRMLWTAGASESFIGLSLAKFAGIALVLLPPTVLMGASLPVLARQVADDPARIGGKVGLLYAINTFGAVAGVFIAGFVAIPGLGMSATLWLTALANLVIGTAAIRMARGWPAVAVSVERAVAVSRKLRVDGRTTLVLIAFGVSGFGALVLEVAWTRVLALVMGSSVYAFSLMLLAFLIGLATGSAAFAALLRRRPRMRPATLLATLLISAGVLAYATAFGFGALPRIVAEVFFTLRPGPHGWFAVQLLLGLLIMFPATFALGGIFPAVLQIHARGLEGVSGSVGTVYASNTLGTIVGAAAAGFLLIPQLGVLPTVMLVALLEVALGVLVLLTYASPQLRRRSLAVLATFVVVVLLTKLTPAWDGLTGRLTPRWDLRVMNSGVYMNLFDLGRDRDWSDFLDAIRRNNEVVYAADGLTASVFVGDQPEFGNRYLAVNGKIEASSNADLETQLMCAHLPLLFHRDPRDVMVIGLASGITVGSVATHPVERIRVVEVEAAMIPAARLFSDANNDVLDDPRVSISVNDARNDLEFSAQSYDVIISEPSNPWMTVASNLFTEDFFRMARARVRPGGIFSQWIQTYYLRPGDLVSIIAAFRSSFPQVMLFETIDGLDLVLLGSEEPLRLDLERWKLRSAELLVAMDLARVEMGHPVDVLSLFRLGPREVDRLVENAPRNTDNNARVEFSAPKSIGVDTQPENTALLRRFLADPLDYVQPPVTDPRERDRLRLRLAEALLYHGDRMLAEESIRRIASGDLRAQADELLRSTDADDSDL